MPGRDAQGDGSGSRSPDRRGVAGVVAAAGSAALLAASTAAAAFAEEPAPPPPPDERPVVVADASAPLGFVDQLRLEAHGFASFGWLRSWNDAWLGDSLEGTTEFHEAALNVLARPADRVRIGAQLFERDLVSYDDSRVDLDWAYVDYRFADCFGVSLGRVKVPFGLYNETLDVDAARTPIFLPVMYPLRSRDLFMAVDGGKAYGSIELRSAGRLEYVGYLGDKRFRHGSSTLQYLSEAGLGDDLTGQLDWEGGGILHWDTPLPGLGLRASIVHVEDLVLEGDVGPGTLRSQVDVENWALSAIYECRPFTIAAEYSHQGAEGTGTIEALGVSRHLSDQADFGYVSLTWHACPWLDWYVAYDMAVPEGNDEHTRRAILAAALRPVEHLVLKVEFEQNDGTYLLNEAINPGGLKHTWQVLALKATVDF